MTPEQWKQIQKIELPSEFEWHQDDNAFGVRSKSSNWGHWFQYTLTDSMSYTQNSIWYHEPSKGAQHQVTTIEDPIHAAQFMAAKILFGIYE